MTTNDPTAREISSVLSLPAPTDEWSLTRRRFLQASGLAAGAAFLPMWLADQAGAVTPLGPTDGVLILLTMEGGCDGLSTVSPIDNGTYYGERGGLARPASGMLQLNGSRGLHPALPSVKSRWDAGQVAIIEGVGDPTGTLSHFESMAKIMTSKSDNGARTSGWVGRYIDGLPGGHDPFHGVCFGHTVPLVAQGRNRQATAVPTSSGGITNPNTANAVEQRQLNALLGMGTHPTGHGPLADALADSATDAVDLARHLAPHYETELPEGKLVSQLVMCARLINANLGIRVFAIEFGDFDGHANHLDHHDRGMQELNDGLDAFYGALDHRYLDRTLLLTTTEFGRRLKANRSGGTDHGVAGTYLAIGSQVRGGFYGQMPSLTNLDRNKSLVPTVDYRSVYTTVLDTWLDADGGEIIGANYENLGFVHRPATIDSGPPPSVVTGLATRDQIFRLYRAYFLRSPDTAGLEHWVGARRSGTPVEAVSDAFASSTEFRSSYGSLGNRAFVDRVYRNVMDRPGDSAGLDYWTGQLNGGVTRGRVMLGFSDSPEFREICRTIIADYDRTGPVARLYMAYFLRAADADGLEYWTSTNQPLASISQAFAESNEFRTMYGNLSNGSFVDLVYSNVMGRTPDSAGRSFWISHLANGASRGSLMVGFSESPEFVASFTG